MGKEHDMAWHDTRSKTCSSLRQERGGRGNEQTVNYTIRRQDWTVQSRNERNEEERKTITTDSRQKLGKYNDLRPDASAFPDKDTTDPNPGRAAAAAAAAAGKKCRDICVCCFNL